MAQLKYEVVKDFLLEEIRKPHSLNRMPSVRQLMERFSVSMATVNRALTELENQQMIIRRPRVGITVNRRPTAIGRTEFSQTKCETTIVVAYTDYPDEGIWSKVYMIEQYCRQNDIAVVNCKLNRETHASEIADFARSRKNCAGVILKHGAGQLSAEELRELGTLNMPIVLYESSMLYDDAPNHIYRLMPDALDGGALMAEVLLRNGHRRIGYLRSEPANNANELQLKGVSRRLKMAGVELPPEQIFSSGISPWESSLDATRKQLEKNLDVIRSRQLTGLIVTSGACALVAHQTLAEFGIRVPDKVSVIGEGDRTFCRYVHPRLTVIDCDFMAMSKLAVEIAAGRKTPDERRISFPHHVIGRESVKDLTPKP